LSAFATISISLSTALMIRMSGLTGEAKMRFFGWRVRPGRVETTLKTG
jgi:hypothetical protein